MIAYCGLDCEKCDAFIATANNDDSLRAKLAEQWSKEYSTQMKPGDINCTGCKSDGVKLFYCRNLCEIRKCALPRGIDTCAKCVDYPCGRLDFVHRNAPDAKERLDALKGKA
jgi:hypothetical protein